MLFYVTPFCKECTQEWDQFVLNEAINGTFLHTRNFLNYHPINRFQDCSIILRDEKHSICAVIPACMTMSNSEKIFFSHKGSTFGGIVIRARQYNTADLNVIIEEMEKYLRLEHFTKIVLKISPFIFFQKGSDLLEYMLTFKGYSQYTELNTYINYSNYHQNITSNFNMDKRYKINKSKKVGYEFRQISSDLEISKFYELLKINLKKYDAAPIHTLEEILDFKKKRLQDNVSFFGVFLDVEMLAAGMVFDFTNCKVAHTQNLCTDPSIVRNYSITYLYYKIIEFYRDCGYRFLSWGISTENKGKKLNTALVKNKESYGSEYCLNRTFYKYVK